MTFLSHPSLVLALIVVVLVILTKTRSALLGPLSSVPGPYIARWTNLRLKLAVIQGRRLHYIHALHQQYGPVVRISPTELSVSDPKAVKNIHKVQSGYRKSGWYTALTNQEDNPGMFSTGNIKVHGERRRLFAQAFTSGWLKQVEPQVMQKAMLAVEKIGVEARKVGVADLLKWWTFMTSDVVTELSFGESTQMLEQGKKNAYVRDLETLLFFSGLSIELPIIALLAKLPIPALRKISGSAMRVQNYGSESIARYRRQMLIEPNRPPTFCTKMIEANALSQRDLDVEATSFIVAGSDTTAVTLTYLIWQVLKRPDVHRKVLQELLALPDGFNENQVRQCQYFEWVITETLRVYGAAPGSLPRVVPSGGRDIAGHFVPEDTIVSTQAYTVHRDGNVFSDPLTFVPERWAKPTDAMKDAFQPFGAGARMCLGLHLAYMELRLAAALFFRRYITASIAPQTTDADMEFENYFLIAPRAHKCLVQMSDGPVLATPEESLC